MDCSPTQQNVVPELASFLNIDVELGLGQLVGRIDMGGDDNAHDHVR